jgi:hypothetical protein
MDNNDTASAKPFCASLMGTIEEPTQSGSKQTRWRSFVQSFVVAQQINRLRSHSSYDIHDINSSKANLGQLPHQRWVEIQRVFWLRNKR